MPKLYEYLGIVVFFYSNEHEPVHVHGRFGEYESKIEIEVVAGVIKRLRLRNVAGKRPLPVNKAKDFKKLVAVYGEEIVHSWVNYFVYHKTIASKRIEGRL